MLDVMRHNPITCDLLIAWVTHSSVVRASSYGKVVGSITVGDSEIFSENLQPVLITYFIFIALGGCLVHQKENSLIN